ncbi:MAG: CsbD family protein [Burkholderiales bacterium]|nr:CsbD family protein [Burkholderiales bacterium]MCH2241858.1 CsbD family protein [Aquabacterium sp.]
MNWDQVQGNWKTFKGKVKERWGQLTDDELDIIEGRRDQLSGALQKRYGWAKDEADRQIDEWERLH